MNEKTDSLNCIDLVFDSSEFPPAEPTPRSPSYEAIIQRERELIRRAGTTTVSTNIDDASSAKRN